MNFRPYKYPHFHKYEIETIICEMLAVGLVQPSCSAYSSHVLLVKRKDGSWCLYVDYRALNAVTIKDCFPIPVIDELFDELYGVNVFSKLDMRSGYYQIRMHSDDVAKTVFRRPLRISRYAIRLIEHTIHVPITDERYLPPIPSPIHPCFFYDIFIYSNDMTTHLQHLHEVFQVLHSYNLKLKLSKCDFGKLTISYLCHILSSQGVAVDP